MSALRPFVHPAAWLGLWICAIIAVIWVCLGPPPEIPELPRNSDKAEHFLAYFLLSLGAVQLFATRRALIVAALGLVLLGVAIEIAQGLFTVDRAPDPFDALANALGVLGGMTLLATPLRTLALRLDRRLFAPRPLK